MSGVAPFQTGFTIVEFTHWDALPPAEIDALARADAETGVVPVLVLMDSAAACRVVSPFGLEATAEVLAQAAAALRRKNLQ